MLMHEVWTWLEKRWKIVEWLAVPSRRTKPYHADHWAKDDRERHVEWICSEAARCAVMPENGWIFMQSKRGVTDNPDEFGFAM